MADYQVIPTYHDIDMTDEYFNCLECSGEGKVDEIGHDEDTGLDEVIGKETCPKCEGTGLQKYER